MALASHPSEIARLWQQARPSFFSGEQPGVKIADVKHIVQVCERAVVRLSAMFAASEAAYLQKATAEPLSEFRKAYSAFLGTLIAQGLGQHAVGSMRGILLKFGEDATKCWVELDECCDVQTASDAGASCEAVIAKKQGEVARLAGKVLETLKKWESVPRTNAIAQKQRLVKQVKQFRDCKRELLVEGGSDDENDATPTTPAMAGKEGCHDDEAASPSTADPDSPEKRPVQNALQEESGNAACRRSLVDLISSLDLLWTGLVKNEHMWRPTQNCKDSPSREPVDREDPLEGLVAKGEAILEKLDELCCQLSMADAQDAFGDMSLDSEEEDDGFDGDVENEVDGEEWLPPVDEIWACVQSAAVVVPAEEKMQGLLADVQKSIESCRVAVA
eukprot:g8812.t1